MPSFPPPPAPWRKKNCPPPLPLPVRPCRLVLPEFPPEPSPVYVLYPQNRQLSPRVRVFIDWLSTAFAQRLCPPR